MMNDLAAFVTARRDEDAAAAMAATPGPWTARPYIYGPQSEGWGDPENGPWEIYAGDCEVVSHQPHEGGGVDGGGSARHIALHDPARALREVEADRRLLAEHAKAERAYRQARDEHARDLAPGRADTQLACNVALDKLMVWERALRHRAAAWSDHPDYRPEWSLPAD